MIVAADSISWNWSAAFGVALKAHAHAQMKQPDESLPALRMLYERIKDLEFEIHSASYALGATRWLLHFSPQGLQKEFGPGKGALLEGTQRD